MTKPQTAETVLVERRATARRLDTLRHNLDRLTKDAIADSLAEIADEMEKRYGPISEAELGEALGRPNELAQLPALIMANIEDVPGWKDSTALVTAHCHAYVLHHDLPEALSQPLPREGEWPLLHHDLRPWAQPDDEPNRWWILRFADPDMREAMWNGPDAETEARAAYAKYCPAWNCYLFATVATTPPPHDGRGEVEAKLDADWFDQVEDLLDDYSDAEIVDGTTHPNKAMWLLCQLREARGQ